MATLLKTFKTYAGSKSNIEVTVYVYANITQNTSKVYADIYCVADLESGAWVQSSGVMFNSKADGYSQKGNTSIVGNTYANGGNGHKDYGGTHTSSTHSYNWDKSTSVGSKNIKINVYRSTDMNSNGLVGTVEYKVSIPAKLYSWQLKFNKNEIDSYTLKVGGTKTTATSGSAIKDTQLVLSDIKTKPQYQLKNVSGATLKNNNYERSMTADANNILTINTEDKTSKFSLYVDNIMTNSVNVTYNSSNNNNLASIIPNKIGYKFLGWYTDSAIQVYDENGKYISGDFWTANGLSLATSNTNLYAHWKIQNIAYVKDEVNGPWKLATIEVKTEDGWQPAIMYTKTENGWQQSII